MALTLTTSPNPSYTYPSQGCCLKYEWDDGDAVITGTPTLGTIHFIWADIVDGDHFYVDGIKYTYKTVISDPTTEILIDVGTPSNNVVNTVNVLRAASTDFTFFVNGNRVGYFSNYIGTRWNTAIDVSPMYSKWDFTSDAIILSGTDTRLQTDYSIEIELQLGGCHLGRYRVYPKLIVDSCSTSDILNQNYTLIMDYDIAELIESSSKVFTDYLLDQLLPEAVKQDNYVGEVILKYRRYYIDSNGDRQLGVFQTAPNYYVGYGLCSESGEFLDRADQIIDGNSVLAKWLTRTNEIVLCGSNNRPKLCIYLPDVTDYGIEVEGFTVGCTDLPPTSQLLIENCQAYNFDNFGSYPFVQFIPTFKTNLDLSIVSGTITIRDGGVLQSSTATTWASKSPSGGEFKYFMPSIQSYAGTSGEETFTYDLIATSGCATYQLQFQFYVLSTGPGEPNCNTVSTNYFTITDITPAGNFWKPDVSTNLTEGLHCFDLTFLADKIGVGQNATFRVVEDVNTSAVSVSEDIVISKSASTNCCCSETFYFLSDIGAYVPITLTCELTHNIELSGPSYVPCSDCYPQDANYAHLTGPRTERFHYNTSYLVKNRYSAIPTPATEDNILHFQDFLSSNDIINSKGERVYIKRNERGIKSENGQIRLSLTMYKAIRQRSLNRY